jgi:hypothetical protein
MFQKYSVDNIIVVCEGNIKENLKTFPRIFVVMATSDRLFSLPKNVSTVARLSLRRFFAEIARKEISVH